MSPSGKIKESDIEAIRDRVDLVKVVSDYVPLKKSGREFRGPCPFHKEKDPSFYINPEKGVYYCFGCKASGGVFNFIMEMDGLSFSEAIEKLADSIGYHITYEKGSEAQVKGRLEKDRLFKLNRTAAEYYSYILGTDEAARAREYLKKRGFDSDVISEFMVGYARPGWSNLCTFLIKKGFKKEEILSVGLARERSAQGQGSPGIYDIFRNRIIFPIVDHRGRFIAFGGRRMPGKESEDEPKYINSPETKIYKKGNTLYGFYQARTAIQDKGEAIIVEGYTDLLALWKSGIKEVVATLGTALTENHLGLLNRYCERLFLAFDADLAGIEAANRVLDLFNRFRMDIYVVKVKPGEDPASIIETGGPEAFYEFRNNAQYLLDFSVERALVKIDRSTPMGKNRALEACVPIMAKINSDETVNLRNELVRKICDQVDMPRESVELFMKSSLKSGGAGGKRVDAARVPAMWEKVEKEALCLLLHCPEALLEHHYLDEDYFNDENSKKIMKMLKEIAACDEEDLLAEYDKYICRMVEQLKDEELRAKVARLLLEEPPGFNTEYGDKVFDRLKYMFFKKEKRKVESEVNRINKDLEPRKYESLCTRLFELDQVIREQFPYEHG
ncbi:MAG: DNA primase [Actinobacteria bacterium]|nr:DNA primase [Actinomycetota bacterium]